MKNFFEGNEDKSNAWNSNPPFSRRHLRAIELALRAAWDGIHKDHTKARKLSSDDEEHISHMLRDTLNVLREKTTGGVKGYNCDIFERPHVGAEIMTPEGKIRKPDIVFSLSGRPRPGVSNGMSDGIYVECKILEQGSSKNISAYCKKGMHRFVEGSYAAWMREGMMLAYVRTSQQLPNDLTKRLEKEEMQELLDCDGKLKKCTLTRINPSVYISAHQRSWTYPADNGNPGPIEVRHLWLYI